MISCWVGTEADAEFRLRFGGGGCVVFVGVGEPFVDMLDD